MGLYNICSFCLKQSHVYQNTPVPTHSCGVCITRETSFLQTPNSTGKSIPIAQSHSMSTKAWQSCKSIVRAVTPPSPTPPKKKCLFFHIITLLLYEANVHTAPIYDHYYLHILWFFLMTQLIGYIYIYRVIHKSLRDFRTRLRNNQDRHGRKQHINR